MDKLNLLWTTTDKDTIFKVISLYAFNSYENKWWDDVNLIIWGGSAKLIAEDRDVRNEVIEMKKTGIKIEACKACSDSYGVTDKLLEMGLDVKYMGEPLTEYLKNGEKVLTF